MPDLLHPGEDELELTEIVKADIPRVDGVMGPANGLPFLILKASGDQPVDCPTCKGDGKILDNKRTCPDCKGTGKVTPDQAADLKKAAAPATADEIRAAIIDEGDLAKSHLCWGHPCGGGDAELQAGGKRAGGHLDRALGKIADMAKTGADKAGLSARDGLRMDASNELMAARKELQDGGASLKQGDTHPLSRPLQGLVTAGRHLDDFKKTTAIAGIGRAQTQIAALSGNSHAADQARAKDQALTSQIKSHQEIRQVAMNRVNYLQNTLHLPGDDPDVKAAYSQAGAAHARIGRLQTQQATHRATSGIGEVQKANPVTADEIRDGLLPGSEELAKARMCWGHPCAGGVVSKANKLEGLIKGHSVYLKAQQKRARWLSATHQSQTSIADSVQKDILNTKATIASNKAKLAAHLASSGLDQAAPASAPSAPSVPTHSDMSDHAVAVRAAGEVHDRLASAANASKRGDSFGTKASLADAKDRAAKSGFSAQVQSHIDDASTAAAAGDAKGVQSHVAAARSALEAEQPRDSSVRRTPEGLDGQHVYDSQGNQLATDAHGVYRPGTAADITQRYGVAKAAGDGLDDDDLQALLAGDEATDVEPLSDDDALYPEGDDDDDDLFFDPDDDDDDDDSDDDSDDDEDDDEISLPGDEAGHNGPLNDVISGLKSLQQQEAAEAGDTGDDLGTLSTILHMVYAWATTEKWQGADQVMDELTKAVKAPKAAPLSPQAINAIKTALNALQNLLLHGAPAAPAPGAAPAAPDQPESGDVKKATTPESEEASVADEMNEQVEKSVTDSTTDPKKAVSDVPAPAETGKDDRVDEVEAERKRQESAVQKAEAETETAPETTEEVAKAAAEQPAMTAEDVRKAVSEELGEVLKSVLAGVLGEALQPLEQRLAKVEEQPIPNGPFLNGRAQDTNDYFIVQKGQSQAMVEKTPEALIKALGEVESPKDRERIGQFLAENAHPFHQARQQ